MGQREVKGVMSEMTSDVPATAVHPAGRASLIQVFDALPCIACRQVVKRKCREVVCAIVCRTNTSEDENAGGIRKEVLLWRNVAPVTPR